LIAPSKNSFEIDGFIETFLLQWCSQELFVQFLNLSEAEILNLFFLSNG
jgi:hypothetical protein